MPTKPDNTRHIVTLETTEAAAPVFMDALAPLGEAVSAFVLRQARDGDVWRIELQTAHPPDRAALGVAVALAAAAAGVPEPRLESGLLPARDWLAENRASFRPLRAGRYYIHPSHDKGAPPPGAHRIVLDAATAFGTGAHGSTSGCLLALDTLARRGRGPRSMLDMGCGSGILAIAMAKTWARPVLAVDIDAEAARVTTANAKANGVAKWVRAGAGPGFAAPILNRAGRFDLITANILANPLRAMAPALARRLAPGGVAVLSGLTAGQTAGVVSAYRGQGLGLERYVDVGEWRTLVLSS